MAPRERSTTCYSMTWALSLWDTTMMASLTPTFLHSITTICIQCPQFLLRKCHNSIFQIRDLISKPCTQQHSALKDGTPEAAFRGHNPEDLEAFVFPPWLQKLPPHQPPDNSSPHFSKCERMCTA